MSKARTVPKYRWNDTHYDVCRISLPKEMLDQFRDACDRRGVTINAVLREAIDVFLALDRRERAAMQKDSSDG